MTSAALIDGRDIRDGIAERREASRQQIMSAAMELFYTKGYEKTTTRDIVKKAGILNGSLYNRFKSKEDILIGIVRQVIDEVLSESGKILVAEKDPLVASLLPCALEIYVSSINRRVADMLYHAHMSWDATRNFLDLWVAWARSHLSQYVSGEMSDEFMLKPIALIGATGNIVGAYANGSGAKLRDALNLLVSTTAGILHVPIFDMGATVDKIEKILTSGEIVIFGHRIDSQLVPSLDGVASKA